MKYGGNPPKVLVHARVTNDGKLAVTIKDNGAGIPLNQRRKVFGRFIRLGNELERSTPGTGLGLYLVRNVVKSLGGSIQVADRIDGTGSQFEVMLKGILDERANRATQQNI